jgi:hypothetical protein
MARCRTSVIWTSIDDTVATVSNAAGSNGLATAVGVGTTIVSASSGDVVGQTTVTVTAATLVSIDVWPATPSVVVGFSQQFTATGHYNNGSTQDLTNVVAWVSSDISVATISNAAGSNGLATGVGAGPTTISASSGSTSGSATLTVTAASPSTSELVAALLNAVNGWGPGPALTNIMTNVQNALAVPDVATACSSLDDFRTLVASQCNKTIPAGQADQFTADADAIDASIPCP